MLQRHPEISKVSRVQVERVFGQVGEQDEDGSLRQSLDA
jgi:hypothetical protein